MDWKGDDIDEESIVAPEPEEGGADAVAKIKKIKDELAETKKEKQEYMDGWQRAKADYVNLLKRGESDAKTLEFKGKIKAVETLLPAFDALERAKEHLPAQAGGEVPEGFMAIAKQLESSFAALGLEAVGTVGEPFDPALHDAMGQDAAESAEGDDKITAVLEKGWKVGENLIRPAKVRVAHYAAKA
jgi:molecular chaperone GrpE